MSHAKRTFPIQGLISCVNGNRWEQCEDVLEVLRNFAISSPIADLDIKIEHAQLVIAFLGGVRERHRPGEVVQTARALVRSKAWDQALQKHPLLLDTPIRPGAWQPVTAHTEKRPLTLLEDCLHVSGKVCHKDSEQGCSSKSKWKSQFRSYMLGCGHKSAECATSPLHGIASGGTSRQASRRN